MLPFDECPDVVPPDEGEDKEAGTEPTAEEDSRGQVVLPGGRGLDATACDALLRHRGGVVVGIVAGPDVGKTTLLATIYELLRRGRLGRLDFAGSETLRAYEERCHLARLSSGGAIADTLRTPLSAGLEFEHVRVATSAGQQDIFFSDRSGEHFQRILRKPGDIGGLIELRRADHVILLVDLKRLLTDLQSTTSMTRRLFMALDQASLLAGRGVHLVGTKADVAIPSPKSRKGSATFAALADELDQRAAGRFAIHRHLVACRPRPGSSAIGEGVEGLALAFATPPAPRSAAPDESWPSIRSELDNLMFRRRAVVTR